MKSLNTGPVQEFGTGWSLSAGVYGGFTRQCLWRVYPVLIAGPG
ncbi:MAG TPA: hypothetical protein PK874_03690 [Desulfobacteraceae bacterium]|nr:hypothetical protein [Desulfobacteraceae bacterium]